MFGSKKKFKLIMNGNSIVEEKLHKMFTLEKEFNNRIRMNTFLIGLKYEMKKFNNEDNNENNMKMSEEEIEFNFPKMAELFKTEKDYFLFRKREDKNVIVDSVEFGMVDIFNKKDKNIFHKDFTDLIDERELESI